MASPDSTTSPAPADRRSFPPDERLEVLTLATERTDDHDCPATHWSLDDLAFELVNRHANETMRQSTIHRILAEADLKPHRSVYWLNSHDPDFDPLCGGPHKGSYVANSVM